MTPAPVIDTEALGRLGEQLGDTELLCGFIRTYESLLDQRVERLRRALTTQDLEDWMDAVLSLKTASALAGAAALSRLAGRLQEDVSGHPSQSGCWPCPPRTAEIMRCLHGLATETAHELRIFVQQSSPAGSGQQAG